MRWCGWFFFGNAILFWLIGINYHSHFFAVNEPYFTTGISAYLLIFVIFSYLGQLALLAVIPGLLVIPITLLFPKRFFIFLMSIILAASSAFLFLLDSVVYNLFHFHLNSLLIDFVLHGNIKEFLGISSQEILVFVLALGTLILIEISLAFGVWKVLIRKQSFKGLGKWAAGFVGINIFFSYSLLIFCPHLGQMHVMMGEVRFLPLYEDFFGELLALNEGRVVIQSLQDGYYIQPPQVASALNYPKQKMNCLATKHSLNIVMIVIDTWRYDMLNSAVTPNLARFASSSSTYTQHYSGGNSTRPGIFSLFYALPPAYWTAMVTQQQSPVLINELMRKNYQFSILSSAALSDVGFEKTIFQALKNVSEENPGANPYERDKIVTQRFKQFIQTRSSSQPFFSFIFYDAAHSYCAFDEDLTPRTPSIKVCDRMQLTNQTNPALYFNRYKNALSLVDQQVEQVLTTLKEQKLLENTVVIITGDHGEEFNDNHLDYWGHASNFTHYQVQTPLMIYWPGKTPKVYTRLTTHYDVVPTLMKEVLGCDNNPKDYSIGTTLDDKTPKPYLEVGSYIATGIIQPNKITTIYPTGNYTVSQSNGQEEINAKLDLPVVEQVLKTDRRFYF